MKYNDEQILSIDEYEAMAKAYSNALKKHGFVFVKVDNEKNQELIVNVFELLSKIKSCLFLMGGFLNTSTLYSLNERQIKRLRVIFDYEEPLTNHHYRRDKTSCFLVFIGLESQLLKVLLQLSEESNFEFELKKIINDRLSALSTIFKETN